MAFTISTIYKAVDKFSPIVRKMEQVNNNFAAKQDKMFKNMGKAIGNVRNQLIGLAGGLSVASLFAIGGSAVIKFDESLNSLSAITGIVGKDFDVFKKEVVNVATRTKKAGYDVAKAFELVGSAQPELLKDAAALSKVSEAAIILSKASREDLTTSASNVTGILNQFGQGADQAYRAINLLSAGSIVGASNISEVTEAMKNSGTVMADANFTMEQGVALLEVLGKFQLKGAEAGTKARGVILKLQKAQLGYQSGIFNINDAIDEANMKMSKFTTAKQKDAFATKIFGAENITAGKIILNNKKLFDEYTKGVTGTNSAFKQAEINSASFSVKLQELRARFENLIIKGNENSKALNRFGNVVTYVTDNLDKILTIIGYAIVAFTGYYAIMTTIRIATIAYNTVLGIFLAFQKAVPISLAANSIAMKAYAVTTNIATGAMKLLNIAFKATPIGWIILGIGVIISLFKHMAERWEGIKMAFRDSGFLGGIKAIGRSLLSFLLKPVEWILKAVAKITGAKWANNILDSISGFRSRLDEGMVAEKPVNTEKVKTERYEEVVKQKLEIELNNKSDKKAAMNYSPAYKPIVGGTFG